MSNSLSDVIVGKPPIDELNPDDLVYIVRPNADDFTTTVQDLFTTFTNSAELVGLRGRDGVDGIDATPFNYIHSSGRLYVNTNSVWCTDSDDNYGPNYYQQNETAGNGVLPLAEWEHMGNIVTTGQRVSELVLRGRLTNVAVQDLEIALVRRHPILPSAWTDGFSGDQNDTDVILWSGLWMTHSDGSPIVGASNLRRQKTISIPEELQLVNIDSDLSIYVRNPDPTVSNFHFLYTSRWRIDG